MRLLALDTSSLACSVAVQCEDRIVVRYEEQARAHTRLLMPMIRDALREADLAVGDLDGIVLGNGPGSFIGMRIGASVAQGLAFAAAIPIVPVSSLLAVAAGAMAEQHCDSVVVCQDAHMNEVYLGLYSGGDTDAIVTGGIERLHDQSPIPELQAEPGRFVSAGFGWERYPALLSSNSAYLGGRSSCRYPSARHLLTAGRALLRTGRAVAPENLVPAYLRDEIARKPASGRP